MAGSMASVTTPADAAALVASVVRAAINSVVSHYNGTLLTDYGATATPQSVGTANSLGTGSRMALEDHVHDGKLIKAVEGSDTTTVFSAGQTASLNFAVGGSGYTDFIIHLCRAGGGTGTGGVFIGGTNTTKAVSLVRDSGAVGKATTKPGGDTSLLIANGTEGLGIYMGVEDISISGSNIVISFKNWDGSNPRTLSCYLTGKVWKAA